MRYTRVAAICFLLFSILSFPLRAQSKEISVTGKLTRVIAIGGESSGWAVQLDSETNIDGKSLHSIEVTSSDPSKFEKLLDKHIKLTGKLTHAHGVETGERPAASSSPSRKSSLTEYASLHCWSPERLLHLYKLHRHVLHERLQPSRALFHPGLLARNMPNHD